MTMNKLLKGSIAGAAGIALLLGGAGTLAYWNDSATLAAGQVQSGTLDIETVGTAVTTYQATGAAVTRAVPGDTIVILQDVEISATGDNLKARLTVDVPASLGGVLGYPGVNLAIVALDAAQQPVAPLNNLTGAQAESITTVRLTATFPSTVSGLDGQGMSIPVNALALKLTQIP